MKENGVNNKGNIPWERFWCPLGDTIHRGNGGFLTDPDEQYGSLANPGVKRLAELVPESGVLVICGEPGIGKSTELASIRATLESECSTRGEQLIWLVFRDVADAADFRRRTVDSPLWRAWIAGAGRLTLVVDGVDEGLLRVPNFVNDLTGVLRDEPIARLRVLLACRTAEWPSGMGRSLFALWPEQKPEPLYELCPLRRKDAVLAADSRGADAEKFLEAVWQRNVIGLAARPITLFFLLREFRGGELPATHRELYERGTENLAREISSDRLELLRALRKTERRPSETERFRAAQRLATLLLVTGRSAIWLDGGAFEDIPPRDLPLNTATDETGGITEDAAREAVESALFTSLGVQRFGFAHQTFAECLAARHLATLPLAQLRSLLCQRDTRGEHVIPQLAELAAWTAGYHHGFCEHLLGIEPEMLIRSDVTRLQGSLKVRLVATLLEGAEREEVFDDDAFDRFLDGVNHPLLASQLRAVISNPRSHANALRIALVLTSRCAVSELTDEVLALVKDASREQYLRDRAASVLEHIIPDARLALLEPLARGEVGADPDDAIRGCSLRRLVPTHWRIRDALPFFSPPQNENLIGSYHVFLEYAAAKHLEDADAAPVVLWLCSNLHCFDSLHPAYGLARSGLARAVKMLGEPALMDAVVELWLSLGRKHGLSAITQDENVRAAFSNDRTVRHRFTASFLNHPDVKPDDTYLLSMEIQLMADTEDLSWLLDELPQTAPDRKAVWAMAIRRMTHDAMLTAPCWDKLLKRIDEVPELAMQYEWLRAWALDEECSIKAKAEWEQRQKWQHESEGYHQRNKPHDYRPDIEKALSEVASGNYEEWFTLWQCLRNDSANSESLRSYEMALYPSWEKLTEIEQSNCRSGARAFLVRHSEQGAIFSHTTWGALAARGALSLLMDSAEDDEQLLRAIGGTWLKAIAIGRQHDSGDMHQRQFALLHRTNPDGCMAALLEELKAQLSNASFPSVLRIAAGCWDSEFLRRCKALFDSLSSPKAIALGIEELASVSETDAAEYAMEFLNRCAPIQGNYPIGLCRALITALLFAPKDALSSAVKMMRDDSELGRVVWTTVLEQQDYARGHLLSALSEEQLGCVYENVQCVLPSKNDPPWIGGDVTSEMSARRIRDRIPNILTGRATEAGCQELLRLATVLPYQSTGLRWLYRDAVTNVRRNLWQPLAPNDVHRMLAKPDARMLQSDDDLLELVLESLARLQTRLTAKVHPAVEDLWRWAGSGNNRTDFRPKDEEALSDYIARWLAADLGPASGVVVGREVQPRRGLRTDVFVEAAPSATGGGFERFAVVIEVKGCWHAEVRTAIRNQLADDYLRPHGLRCGVYLVGWFLCPRWSKSVCKLSATDAEAARAELYALAIDFTDGAADVRIAPVLLDCTF